METQIAVLACVAIVAIVVIILLLTRRRNKPSNASAGPDEAANSHASNKLVASDTSLSPTLFEEVVSLTEDEESRLVKIEDNKLLATIDRAIPVAAQAGVGAGAAAKVAQDIAAHNKAMKAGGQLFRVVIPHGAKLADSQAIEGAKRGLYHGAKGIRGHANLITVEQPKMNPHLGKELVAANAVGNAMNVAALIVGQYYMSQINGRLDSIERGIDKIARFQDAEYQSKVNALVAAVKKSSTFQFEIMDNDELRLRELAYLKERENECAQLLGQASIALKQIATTKPADFGKYKSKVAEANNWLQYQQVLLQMMFEVSELTYTLNKGAMSHDSSYAMLTPYGQQAKDSREKLMHWHEKNEHKLKIDVSSSRRRRQGLDKVGWAIPALFNSDLRYKSVSRKTTRMIRDQKEAADSITDAERQDLYQEDVVLIKSGGAIYYLLPAEDK